MSTRKKYKHEGEVPPQSRGKIEYPSVSEEERQLARETLLKAMRESRYRSDGPYPSRDELYDEMFEERSRCS